MERCYIVFTKKSKLEGLIIVLNYTYIYMEKSGRPHISNGCVWTVGYLLLYL